jgi:hypothetical protein
MKDAYLTMSKEIVPISRLEGDVVQNFWEISFFGGGGEHLTFEIHIKYFWLEQNS